MSARARARWSSSSGAMQRAHRPRLHHRIGGRGEGIALGEAELRLQVVELHGVEAGRLEDAGDARAVGEGEGPRRVRIRRCRRGHVAQRGLQRQPEPVVQRRCLPAAEHQARAAACRPRAGCGRPPPGRRRTSRRSARTAVRSSPARTGASRHRRAGTRQARRARPRAGALCASMGAEMSMPVTCAPGPRWRASASVWLPQPQPMSSARVAVSGPMRASSGAVSGPMVRSNCASCSAQRRPPSPFQNSTCCSLSLPFIPVASKPLLMHIMRNCGRGG